MSVAATPRVNPFSVLQVNVAGPEADATPKSHRPTPASTLPSTVSAQSLAAMQAQVVDQSLPKLAQELNISPSAVRAIFADQKATGRKKPELSLAASFPGVQIIQVPSNSGKTTSLYLVTQDKVVPFQNLSREQAQDVIEQLKQTPEAQTLKSTSGSSRETAISNLMALTVSALGLFASQFGAAAAATNVTAIVATCKEQFLNLPDTDQVAQTFYCVAGELFAELGNSSIAIDQAQSSLATALTELAANRFSLVELRNATVAASSSATTAASAASTAANTAASAASTASGAASTASGAASTATTVSGVLGTAAATGVVVSLAALLGWRWGAAKHLMRHTDELVARNLHHLNRKAQNAVATNMNINATQPNFNAIRHGSATGTTGVGAQVAREGIDSLIIKFTALQPQQQQQPQQLPTWTGTTGTIIPVTMAHISTEISNLLQNKTTITTQSSFLKNLIIDAVLQWWIDGPEASLCSVLEITEPLKDRLFAETRSAIARYVRSTLDFPTQPELKGETLDTVLCRSGATDQAVVTHINKVADVVQTHLLTHFVGTATPEKTGWFRQKADDLSAMRSKVGKNAMTAECERLTREAAGINTNKPQASNLAAQIEAKITKQ